MIKTFRGILADGGQDRIKLSTIKGQVGYKISKFQVIGQDASESYEAVTKIYTTLQSTIDDSIDFTVSDLLAVAMYQQNITGQDYPLDQIAIFDGEIINQDIYITYVTGTGSGDMNYYIELEVIPLTEQAAEYTTIKDLRAKA